jgi:hypothetical protein
MNAYTKLVRLSNEIVDGRSGSSSLWQGADVIITSKSPISDEGGFYPAPRYVVTFHAHQLSWLFEQIRDVFIEIEDYGFIPTESDQEINLGLIDKIKDKPIEVAPTTITASDKEVELEKAKAETKKAEAEIEKAISQRKKDELRMKIIELFASDKITEAKMDKMLKDIG